MPTECGCHMDGVDEEVPQEIYIYQQRITLVIYYMKYTVSMLFHLIPHLGYNR